MAASHHVLKERTVYGSDDSLRQPHLSTAVHPWTIPRLGRCLPELEWFANLTNPNTRRAYRQDIDDFMAFTGLWQPEQFRAVTRAHVIAWRDQLVRRPPQ